MRALLKEFDDFFTGVTVDLDSRVDWDRVIRSTTAAAVTVIHPTRAKRVRPTERWLTQRFEEGLRALDRVLCCIGFISGTPDVGAVRWTELPPRVLAIVDDMVPENREKREVLPTKLQLHSFGDWTAALIGRPTVLETAIWLADRLGGAGAPFRLFVEYAQRSRRDLLDGMADQAVISAGTAVETLLVAVLTAVWRADGVQNDLIRLASKLDFKTFYVTISDRVSSQRAWRRQW